MKILILHNCYQQQGGEDAVVRAEYEMLQQAGHDVRLVLVSNDQIIGLRAKTHAFFNAPYDPARKNWLANLLANDVPDIVHIHNFFPLLTPAIHEVAAQMGCAVVQTLHNYRLLCAGAQLLRDGKVCEKCLGGNRYWGTVHRCYRNSLPGSFAAVQMQNRAFRTQTWQKHVHQFVALTQFSANKFAAGGLPAHRISVKPNFVKTQKIQSNNRAGALYVGRLSAEKGVETLIGAMRPLPDTHLTIAGEGPDASMLKAMAPPNVTFVGQQTTEDVKSLMQNALMLVQPSICYEGFPMSIVEAFAHHLPVVASRIGSLAEIVVPQHNGALFNPADPSDLAKVMQDLFNNQERLKELGKEAQTDQKTKYSPQTNLPQLEQIYAKAITQSQLLPI